MSDKYAPIQWHPEERPTMPGGPSFPNHSTPRRARRVRRHAKPV